MAGELVLIVKVLATAGSLARIFPFSGHFSNVGHQAFFPLVVVAAKTGVLGTGSVNPVGFGFWGKRGKLLVGGAGAAFVYTTGGIGLCLS